MSASQPGGDRRSASPHSPEPASADAGRTTDFAAAETVPHATPPNTDASSAPTLPHPAEAGQPRTPPPRPDVHADGGRSGPVHIPGYEILGELGRGGMGVVYKARQTKLGRTVALKMILSGGHAGAADLARFVTEAEAIARLQHPNIVQIHEVGEHGGLPFFSLEFCPGGSLDRKLAGTPLPPREAAALVEALARAMQAAHDKGVVHRDLKPANVLLADDGTPKITDFGLAKKMEEAGQTASGAILGTPSYMAPEQAAGNSKEVGPPTDVYALGAILYELLTGRAPFKAATALDTVRQVVTDEPAPPSRLQSQLPRDLETVCLKCLRKEPGRRYASALDLAEDLRRFRAGEPIRARPVGSVERGWRWCRRNPAVAALLGAVAALLLLGGGGAFLLERQRAGRRAEQAREEARLREGVEGALKEVAGLEARGRWGEAPAVLAQAAGRLGEEGPADLRARVERAQADLDLVARLEDIRLSRAATTAGRIDLARADRKYSAAFAEAGLAREDDDPAEVAGRVRDSAVSGPLVAALDDWAFCAQDAGRRAWLLEVARKADPDPWRDRARQPVAWQDRETLQKLLAEEGAADQLPELVALLAGRLQVLGGDAAGVLRRAQARHPDDFWLNFQLGLQLWRDDPAESAGYYRAALALRPDATVVRKNLGAGLRLQGKLPEAEELLRTALRLDPTDAGALADLGAVVAGLGRRKEAEEDFRAAIRLDPESAPPHYNLALLLSGLGRGPEAEQEYRTAIRLDPGDTAAHNNLGNLLRDQGKREEAEAEYRAAIRLDPKFAQPHNGLGNVLRDQGKRQEAEAEYRAAIRLDPKSARPHHGLGALLYDQGKLQEAEAEYRAAIRLDPGYALPHIGLGIILYNQGRRQEGEQEFRAALRLDPRSAFVHNLLGSLLKYQGRLEEARQEYQQAVALGLPGAAEALRQCDRLIPLAKRLAAVLRGDDRPADAQEMLAFAELCSQPFERRLRAAARFCGKAFAADPKLAEDRKAGHRYNAACYAALAGCGQGKDEDKLEDAEKARLRRQALDWLRADLGAWAKLAQGKQPADRAVVRQTLRHWKEDADLAGVRGDALTRLAEAERGPWQKLWADVDALLATVSAPGQGSEPGGRG